LYWGSQKQGFHIDEIFSYQNSNGYFEHKQYDMPGFSDTWHTGDYFLLGLYTHEDQRFSYGTVASNVSTDSSSHPPLFHFALHTTSSLFPGTFSKWIRIVPNIFYFIVAQVYLFLIGTWFWGEKNRWLALLPCLIWGFSAGAISMVIYIRMYYMQLMWISGVVYCHLKLLSAKKSVKWLLWAGVFAFLSFMTHFYSIIFLFFIAACYVFFRLIRHGWKAALAYAASILGALGLMVVCWPTSIMRGIISGQRGKEAVSNFKGASLSLLMDHLYTFLSYINKALFYKWGWVVLCALVLLLLILLVKKLFTITLDIDEKTGTRTLQFYPLRKARYSFILSDKFFAYLFLFISLSATLIILAIVAPYRDLRYIAFLLPVALLLLLLFVKWISERLFKHKAVFPITMAVLFTCITLFSYQGDNILYLYKNQETYRTLIEESGSDTAVCFYESKYRTSESVIQFSKFTNVYCTDAENIGALQDILDGVNHSNGIMIYLDKTVDQDSAIQTILESTNLVEHKKLFTTGYFIAYYFSI
jgi:hypothetical protein